MSDATLSTSDSQETPQTTPLLQTTMATFYMPMPRPRSHGSPLFEGSNALEFFRRYEQDCKDYHVPAGDQLKRLLNYCTLSITRTVRFMKQWIAADYDGLRKAMLKHYAKDNIKQRMYTTAFLNTYQSTPCTKKDDTPDYCCNFNLIA
jgi:hypothetical protein